MVGEQELHPVTELLLKRIESHPEEFVLGNRVYHNESRKGKLSRIYDATMNYAPERDKQLLEAARSKAELDALHHELMDELFNGEERRAREEEVERQKAFAAAQISKHLYSPAQLGAASVNQYANQLQNYQSSTLGSTVTGTSASSLWIDDEVLDAPLIKNMKKMLSGSRKE